MEDVDGPAASVLGQIDLCAVHVHCHFFPWKQAGGACLHLVGNCLAVA